MEKLHKEREAPSKPKLGGFLLDTVKENPPAYLVQRVEEINVKDSFTVNPTIHFVPSRPGPGFRPTFSIQRKRSPHPPRCLKLDFADLISTPVANTAEPELHTVL